MENRIKVVPYRFQQCLGPVKMLTAEGCSETRSSRDLSNHVFPSQRFRKYLRKETDLFFFKVLKN